MKRGLLIAVISGLLALASAPGPILAADVPGPRTSLAEIESKLTQWASFPDDQAEIGGLKPEHSMFADYCLKARETIRSGLTQGSILVAARANAYLSNSSRQGDADSRGLGKAVVGWLSRLANRVKQTFRRQEPNPDDYLDALIRGAKEACELMDKGERDQLACLGRDEFERIIQFLACHELNVDLLERVNTVFNGALRELPAQEGSHRPRMEDVGCASTARLYKAGMTCKDILGAVDVGL